MIGTNDPFNQSDLSFLPNQNQQQSQKTNNDFNFDGFDNNQFDQMTFDEPEPQDDFISFNKSNPEIFTELKERIIYNFSATQGIKLKKIEAQGLFGIMVNPSKKINKKEFSLCFKSDNWKNENHFIDRQLCDKLEKKGELDYKLKLADFQGVMKLLSYKVNQNSMIKIKSIQPQIWLKCSVIVII